MKRLIMAVGIIVIFSGLTFATEQSPGLVVGVQAPDFEATNYQGQKIRLSDYYKKGPVVLIFYRGGWCHYCNLQLQEYQQHLEDFKRRGVDIIAVSVDKVEQAAKTVEQKQLGFEVVSNPDADVLKLYNVIYQVPLELAQEYKDKYNIDLQEASGRSDRIIAVSATYVINSQGQIIFAYANKDYTVRKSSEEILQVLDELAL